MLQSKSNTSFYGQASLQPQKKTLLPLIEHYPNFYNDSLVGPSHLAWRRDAPSLVIGSRGTINTMPYTTKHFPKTTFYSTKPLGPDTSQRWWITLMDSIWLILNHAWMCLTPVFQHGGTSLRQLQVSSQSCNQIRTTTHENDLSKKQNTRDFYFILYACLLSSILLWLGMPPLSDS